MNPKAFNVNRMVSESEETDESCTTDGPKCLFEDGIVRRLGSPERRETPRTSRNRSIRDLTMHS